MDAKDELGGACGDLGVDLSLSDGCFNILVESQYFEYKLSHYIEKTYEGCFSY